MHKQRFGMSRFNIDQLRTLCLVAECRTFSGAAERLGISQPAVSLHVRNLEEVAGVKLVERVGKRTSLTRAGEALVRHARQIDAYVESAFAEVRGFQAEVYERVRIGTGATACIYLLPAVLGPLKRRFPSLQISVKTGNTRDILKELEANALDLGFVTLPAQGAAFAVTPVLSEAFVAISLAEVDPLPEKVTPPVLAGGPLILYEAGANTRRLTDEWFQAAETECVPVMELGSVEAIRGLVEAGLGRAILPASAVAQASAASRLTIRPLDPPLGRQLALVLRKDKLLSRGLRAAVDALQSLEDARRPQPG
jgi:molybdate transport repressor ModE-like protein